MLASVFAIVVRGLVRRTWLVVAATVLGCASFAAHAVAAYVDADRVTAAPPPAARPVPVPARPAPRPKGDGGALVARNMFCSSCDAGAAGAPSAPTGAAAVLIATMRGREPRAVVRVVASEAQGSWGLGERIPGVGTIEHIGVTAIDVIDAAGQRRRLSLLDDAPRAGGRAGAATPTAAPATPFADRITRLGDGRYEVERALVRELVTGATGAGGARAVPLITDGDVRGVRLVGVRGGSVAAALGLRSGDVIAAIDGAPIKNAQQLLDLYAKLDRVAGVELTGTRAGKPLALALRLR